MIGFLKKFFSSDLGKGSLILFIMMNIFNFLNYVFHFGMARVLTAADYGTLVVLMSIVYIYSMPAEAIQGTLSRYAAKFNIQKEYRKIKFLMSKGIKKILLLGLVVFVASTIVGLFLAEFLNINFWLIFITNLLVFGIFIGAVLRGVLQGKKKFYGLGTSMISEAFVKLVFAIMFVLIGWKVYGALVGVLVGIVFGIIWALVFLRDVLYKKPERVEIEGLSDYSKRFLWVMIVIVLMYSVDIFLAKRFFPEDLAGKYAVLSTLSKMIFFGTLPISKALFPISSEKFVKNHETKSLFYKSAALIIALCSIAILAFLFFPQLVIGVLFGAKYIDIAVYLIYTGIALSFLSVTNLVVIYGLSINRFKRFYYLFLFVILEIVLLALFHQNLLEFTLAFMFSNIIMFLGSLFLIKLKD